MFILNFDSLFIFLLSSLCFTTSVIALLLFSLSKKKEKESSQEQLKEIEEEEKESSEEEVKEIELNFNECMRKGYLTLEEKQYFKEKYLKK